MFLSRSLRTLGRHRHFSTSQLQALKSKNAPVDVHPEVADALASNKPVVALETALVSHGLPFPQSLDVPLALEEIVRSRGAVPATIGLIQGRVKIGLTRAETERLAHGETNKNARKISRRDIGAAIATGVDGGTTCAATLVFAALAGIKVFATGGLGGVHRGGENTLDVSADLQELTRSPVGLVSSGVKSILDIKRTLEYLETAGVPVISYNSTREFPAFFSRHSGFNAPWNINDPLTAAKMLYTQAQLNMPTGALIAVPIPEEHEAAGLEIQEFVNQAVRESEANGVSATGNDATPWLLNRVYELSKGRSLQSNIALLSNTAHVGAQIAVEYQKLAAEQSAPGSGTSFTPALRAHSADSTTHHKQAKASKKTVKPANMVIVGSAAVDVTAQESPNKSPTLAVHSTAPGKVSLTLGGVGRNVAEATHRVMQAYASGHSSLLVAPVGKDSFGHLLVDEMESFGMRTDGLILSEDKATAVCNMVLDSEGALVGGVAAMDITEQTPTQDYMREIETHSPSIIAIDGNLPTAAMEAILPYANAKNLPVLFEPTSTVKCTRILPAILTALRQKSNAPVTYATPNLLELTELYETANQEVFHDSDHPAHASWWSTIDSLGLDSTFRNGVERMARYSDETINLEFLLREGTIQKAVRLLPFFQHLIIKCGDRGVLVVMRIDPESVTGWAGVPNSDPRTIVCRGQAGELLVVRHISALPMQHLVNVTGAGDTFVGALLATLAQDPTALYSPKSLEDAVMTSQRAAVLTLQSHHAVSPVLQKMALPEA